jgi:hypothetical protein
MGIFSRKTEIIPGAGLRKLEIVAETKSLNGSKTGSESLEAFLTEHQLISNDDPYAIERTRKRIEESGLVHTMVDTCNSINKMVGRTIVDVHSFLPPIPILCCFIFVGHGAEYFMRLELQDATPTLIFAERTCRDTVTSDFVRWTCRLANVEPENITIKLVHEFQEIRFSVEQVREWFKYLVSGLDRSYTPSF